ncbi:NERD domain-containing protein (plasmid) [Vibrio harveyi]|nr:NERD domain-containing protein [Vibrio harveyi]
MCIYFKFMIFIKIIRGFPSAQNPNLFIGAFGELLNQPTTWMLILAVTLLFVAKVFSRHIKGKIGEWALSKILNKKCGNNCIVLDDVTLEVSDGDTTQVDHVVISPAGIFVVETKHYKGWIYGKESDQFWTQKIFKRSYKFQNPFRQNYKHVKAIQSLLPSIPQEAFYSIVVMVGECEWRSKNTPKATIHIRLEIPQIIFMNNPRKALLSTLIVFMRV